MTNVAILFPTSGEPTAGEYNGRSIGCPCCGYVSQLTPEHRVLECGTVDRLFVCANEGCVSLPLWLELAGG